MVQDARAFLRQGRPEAALRATTRGLAIRPDDAPLLRTRARALDALARTGEAESARARADALDPPPPPLPMTPRDGHFEDLLLVMQAPEVDLTSSRARQRAQSTPQLRDALLARIALRLPGTLVAFEADQSPETVPAARAWLEAQARPRMAGLHVGRAFCGESIKDGPYAVASLHRSQPGTPPLDGPVRWAGRPEAEGAACSLSALERALEAWLEAPFFDTRRADDTAAPLSREDILVLLPDLRARIEAEHTIARRSLFVGDLESARAAYERTAELDPEDVDIAEHIAEIDRTLALNRELAQLEARTGAPSPPPGVLPARLTPAQRAALEQQLEAERRNRDNLLATLATLTGDRRIAHVPLAALRSAEVLDVDAKGPERAWTRLGRDARVPEWSPPRVERLAVRTLHSPSGALIARYYFDRTSGELGDEGEPVPVLIEEDASGDGEIDRWTTYAGGIRAETWEERRSEDLPDLHMVHADDGRGFVRVELDEAGDGTPDRIYAYVDGLLAHASIDSNGDGRLDHFDHFDADGRVTLRDEDLTGDGRIDVRTHFREGRLVKREIMDPAALDGPS